MGKAGRPGSRNDQIVTMDQVRLIPALHEADLGVNRAARILGINEGTARSRIGSIELHTGVDVLTLHGLGQLYDAALALVEHWEGCHGQTD